MSHPLRDWMIVLVIIAAFSKSAQFPFSSWLPRAMVAPAPVSAYLHSATMVTLGVYLLARFLPVFGEASLFRALLVSCGSISFVLAGAQAFLADKFKVLLAQSTVSGLGLMTLLIGLGTPHAVQAFLVLYLVHALYKSSLFMLAGGVTKDSGAETLAEARGLPPLDPVSRTAALLSLSAMAGLPPLLAFISKELMIQSKLAQEGWLRFGLMAVGIAGNALVSATAFVLISILAAGWRQWREPLTTLSALYVLPPLLLGMVGFGLGLIPGVLSELILSRAFRDLMPLGHEVTLKIWHGFDAAFMASLATFILAFGLAFHRPGLLRRRAPLLLRDLSKAVASAFDRSVAAAPLWCGRLAGRFQTGLLSHYLTFALVSLCLLSAVELVLSRHMPVPAIIAPPPAGAAGALTIVTGALVLLRVDSRVGGILSLALVGLGGTLVFMAGSAPDVALTQILVETLTLAIFVSVVAMLPKARFPKAGAAPLWQHLLAGLLGCVFSVLHLEAIGRRQLSHVSAFFLSRAVPEAFGANVVNVILVDFRALDTFGEVLVIGVAALGVLPLVRLIPGGGGVRSALFPLASAILIPLQVALSVFFLLRGHNMPGGGFIGGLVASLAYVMARLAESFSRRTGGIGEKAPALIACGWVCMVGSALPGLLRGEGGMAGWWGPTAVLPLVGSVKLGTVLFFDAGVYLTVIGAVLKIAHVTVGKGREA